MQSPLLLLLSVRMCRVVVCLYVYVLAQDSVVASADLAGHILGHSVATGDKVWHLSAINKVLERGKHGGEEGVSQ